MKYSRILLLLWFAVPGLMAHVAQASDEDSFLGQARSPTEQIMGQGQSALWTLPLVATQYQPLQPAPAIRAALLAQHEGRFLDAQVGLDKAGADAETNLLRASFLLQGNLSGQALEILAPMLDNTQYAADAYALTAMAQLQLGQMQKALLAAQRAHDLNGGVLQYLVLSYALQGSGHLLEAREKIHGFNQRSPSATALAREAELALMLAQIQAAKELVKRALETEPTDSYAIAVSALAYLIDGKTQEAKSAFEKTLRRDPKDAKALLGLGLAEIKLGNFGAGQKALQAADEAAPNNALILTYLGRSQQQSGKTEAAKESYRLAQQADPKDPVPWLYQAQAALQANRLEDARESLREALVRTAYRQVYRGDSLLKEDEQLLQANLAEIQRQSGLESLAFHTLSDSLGEKSSASLRNQADVLQGQRFGESARRSLLLQSLFDERPGNLPSASDIYGDGAGQTGATVPQHGAVGSLGAQQASYNNYDALFNSRTTLEVDATTGSKNTGGEQMRLGVGNDTLGLSLAGLQFKSDGFAPYDNLNNRIAQAIVHWRPAPSTQAFLSYQNFNSKRGEIVAPADPLNNGLNHQYEDNSAVTRLGLRHSPSDNSELRVLLSRQQTRQTDNWEWPTDFLPPQDPNYTVPTPILDPALGYGPTYGTNHNSSSAHGVELQYRRSGADYAAQWGLSSARSPFIAQSWATPPLSNVAQQIYVDWQQALSPYWQLEAGLAWGKNDKLWSNGNTYLRNWLPKLGLVYTPDSATHVRLAAWKNLDDAAVGNASLASPTLAGITLNRPGDTYKQVRGIALGADKQLDASWLLEGQAQRRWSDDPYFLVVQKMKQTRVDESRLALHWHNNTLNATLAYEDEFIQKDPAFVSTDSVLKQHLRSQQLGLKWFASQHWTANLEWSHNLLSAIQQSSNPTLLDVRQRFNQTDASLNWKLKRAGSLDMGVRNATGRSIQYTDIDPLLPRFSKGRLYYLKLKLIW